MNPFALPVHPAVVHFPIALVVMGWLSLLAYQVTHDEQWRDRAWVLEVAGALTLPVAIAAGIIDTRGLRFVAEPRWDGPLIWHAIAGVAATLLIGSHAWFRRRRGELLDVAALTVGVWLVTVAGLIGGEMVFGA